jgi:hypothetical protein
MAIIAIKYKHVKGRNMAKKHRLYGQEIVPKLVPEISSVELSRQEMLP